MAKMRTLVQRYVAAPADARGSCRVAILELKKQATEADLHAFLAGWRMTSMEENNLLLGLGFACYSEVEWHQEVRRNLSSTAAEYVL